MNMRRRAVGRFLAAVGMATMLSIVPGRCVTAQAAAPGDREASDTSFAVDKVDEPVQVRSCPRPDYPRDFMDDLTLVQVKLQYIVDTLGFAEPNSIHLVGRKPPVAFVEPAIDAIQRCRFKPAKLNAKPVRQLVQQAVVFYPPNGVGPAPRIGEMPWQ
jgi:TonB-like protein